MTERRWELPIQRKPLTAKEYAKIYLKQDGKCGNCKQRLEIKGGQQVEVWDEHLQPLSFGGTNDLSNRELWCYPCTKPKTSKEATQRATEARKRNAYLGAKKSTTPLLGSKRHHSGIRKRMDGTIEKWGECKKS